MQQILWVDDDSPREAGKVRDCWVHPVHSCEAAERAVQSTKVRPDCYVVDLMLPQGNWGDKLFKVPGLEYVRHLSKVADPEVPIVVYSIMLTQDMAEEVKAAGAAAAFDKLLVPFSSVVSRIERGDLKQ